MNDDNTRANQRGSSPPFQESDQDIYDWLKELASIGKRVESAQVTQVARRPVNDKPTSADQSNGDPRLSE